MYETHYLWSPLYQPWETWEAWRAEYRTRVVEVQAISEEQAARRTAQGGRGW
jgi:hypothetical protein